MIVIRNFSGEFEFLSTFHTCVIVFEGDTYNSVEHAFQAAKTDDQAERRLIRQCRKASEAKRLGRRLTLRSGWDDLRVGIMHDLLRFKFSDDQLGAALKRTGDALLVHGNPYNETFWGECRGTGENWLGRLLMEVRSERQSILD